MLGRIISGITHGSTKVSVPAGWGVRLEMKAGDVEIKGPLAYLAGHLLAGDLDANELHGIDLSVSAGDIDVALLVSEGRHRVRQVAGDTNVRLLNGSDTKATGHVGIGDLSLPPGWKRNRRGLGWEFEHVLGEGAGEVRLELGTGDLDVEAGNG
jgi:hypothetical protein